MKEYKIMSGQTQDGLPQYLGIMNGIVYRIDTSSEEPGKKFGLVPLEIQHCASSPDKAALSAYPASLLTALASSGVAKTSVTQSVSEASVKRAPAPEVSFVTLFTRDGPEPLRAGHPDLWHLLVAGTCLEGSEFKSTV
jgi:hypothetical protein